jgi:ATP-dependent Lhr-like helicase
MLEISNPLGVFHPAVRAWFVERFGDPTAVQRAAWPLIAAGEHVLATAPTGSGKTLAAFLWALDRLLTGAWPGGATRVVYVSPLRALNNDIQRNLLAPLEELRARLLAAGYLPAEVKVLTRSGDTPAEERARMARRPPEILITTPESLNILLTSRRGRAMLGSVVAVILDELHAVVGNKRGVHLITAVERLAALAGEPQRIALSATVRPLERVAQWLGGYQHRGGDSYRRRPVQIVAPPSDKCYDLQVRFPAAALSLEDQDIFGDGSSSYWQLLVSELRRMVDERRSTLVFANSRRMVEKLTRLLNQDEAGERVYSHHGSLAREVRAVVEARLRAGELRAIVATSSLELGIDIGSLDQVVLVQTPPTVASAVQRIGRAGHAVGATSRARFVPLVTRDLLDAVVVAEAATAGDIEEVTPPSAPLDVLAQVIVSMTATQTWQLDELEAVLRSSDTYHSISRGQLELVLEMLAGRYAEIRIRELRPMVSIDRVEGTVRGRPGVERVVYLAGGTIPDRGYFHLRRVDSGALLGELDEEFVWERSVGDSFTLGVQSWRVVRVTHNDVFVEPTRGGAAMAPFWRADERDRSHHLAERLAVALEELEPRLDEPALPEWLASRYGLDAPSARALVAFLVRQLAATGRLPNRRRIVAERTVNPQGRGEESTLYLHTLWGGRVNRPFALALQAAWEERHGAPLEVAHDDDCVAITAPDSVSAGELLALVEPAEIERLLRARLERSGYFGARFREAAGCALLLPREGFQTRTPLWLSRQRAKQLLESVRRFDDFPLVLEAWRACLLDGFELAVLARLLDEVTAGAIELHEVRTDRPSPMAAHMVWKRTNALMYADDAAELTGPSKLRHDLLREVVLSSHLRPRLSRALISELERKLQRTFPGYAPRSAEELFDWIVERVVVPSREWHVLLAACSRDGGDVASWLVALEARIIGIGRVPGSGACFVTAWQSLPRVLAGLGLNSGDVAAFSAEDLGRPIDDALHARLTPWLQPRATGEHEVDPLAELLAELLRFYGPVEPTYLIGVVGVDVDPWRAALEALVDSQRAVLDQLVADDDSLLLCDTENLERLLRLTRAARRVELEPLPPEQLPLFLATWQKVGVRAGGIDDLRSCLEPLFGFGAPAHAWETEILPARLEPYQPSWLDALLGEGELVWFGCGEHRVAFALGGDRELFVEPPEGVNDRQDRQNDEPAPFDPLPSGSGRYRLEELVGASDRSTAQVADALWRGAWRGELSTDSFSALRRAVETGFRAAEPAAGGRPKGRPPRLRFERWQTSRPFSGVWYRLLAPEAAADALDAEELAKDRARALLARYGVVFRQLCERELPVLGWGRVFRALRLLELSGEVVTGQLLGGVEGLQFAVPSAVRLLREGLPLDQIWWLSAADPASPCGLALQDMGYLLPGRVWTTHLVFHGARLVLVSKRRGGELDLTVCPDDPYLGRYFEVLKSLMTRQVKPRRAIVVRTINGSPAAESPYCRPVAEVFHTVRDGGALRLSRRY